MPAYLMLFVHSRTSSNSPMHAKSTKMIIDSPSYVFLSIFTLCRTTIWKSIKKEKRYDLVSNQVMISSSISKSDNIRTVENKGEITKDNRQYLV